MTDTNQLYHIAEKKCLKEKGNSRKIMLMSNCYQESAYYYDSISGKIPRGNSPTNPMCIQPENESQLSEDSLVIPSVNCRGEFKQIF